MGYIRILNFDNLVDISNVAVPVVTILHIYMKYNAFLCYLSCVNS